MMTFLQKTGRCVYWLAVVALSVAVCWLVNDWLEPRPVWSVPIEDTLVLTHYQPSEKLLTGYRLSSSKQMELVVIDPAIGKERARLETTTGKPPEPDTSPCIDSGPRIYGDKVVRFVEHTLDSGETLVEFRSWDFLHQGEERVLAQWKTLRETSHNRGLMLLPWLHTIWPMHDEGLVLIYHSLPTDWILNSIGTALSPELLINNLYPWRRFALSMDLCEVWRYDQGSRQFRRVTIYSVPSPYRTLSQSVATYHSGFPPQNPWTVDGRHYTQVTGWTKGAAAITQVDVLTGEGKPYSPFEGEQQRYSRHTAGQLIQLKRHQLIPTTDANGRVSNYVYQSPTKKSIINWGINEWRPMLEAKSLIPVVWPASLNQSIVGEDRFLVDALDPNRYLYHSNVWDESPHCRPPPHAGYNSYFVLLRYQDGRLEVESQWHHDERQNCSKSVLCGQLFIECTQGVDLPQLVARTLVSFPSFWNYYQERAKINAPYVAEVTTDEGILRWKKMERVLAPIPILGKDYLLLQHKTIHRLDGSGYECWKLPMVFYSLWWGRSAGLLVFIGLLLLKFQRAVRVLFTKICRKSGKSEL